MAKIVKSEADILPLTEPTPIHDTFATGADFQFWPEFTRLLYWVEQPVSYGPHNEPLQTPGERVIVARIVIPSRAFDLATAKFRRQYRSARGNEH